MIKSWQHKGLKQFYLTGNVAGVKIEHTKRLKLILQLLNSASSPDELNLPGLGFHKLIGDLKGFFSVTVKKNWRIIFRFEDQDAILVNYLDYH